MEGSHLYKGRLCLDTLRYKKWDYGASAHYFVTICTKNKLEYFGQVQGGQMNLSPMGQIAHETWLKIPEQFGFVTLGNVVVMPDHVHGIISIERGSGVINRAATGEGTCGAIFAEVDWGLKDQGGITGSFNPMGNNTLGEIIRWFKGKTTFNIRRTIPGAPHFTWQSRYHDKIIFTEQAYRAIWRYIEKNPQKWTEKYGHIDE